MIKYIIKYLFAFFTIITSIIVLASCKERTQQTQHLKIAKIETNTALNALATTRVQTNTFKDYWFSGKAEITSYYLEQARYGEMRQGKAVLIYVTEDFEPTKQVKADNQNEANIPILKLNATKTFNTGIYPYSVMQSTFYPVANNKHALKVTASIQEWCGHVYTQLNNKTDFEVQSYSYFESESDKKFNLKKTILENELWIQLRINPKQLPVGSLKIIPSLEFSNLKHVKIKAYNATAIIHEDSYTITYPDLQRSLLIKFNPTFPYDIIGWEETFISGYGTSARVLTTKASKLKTIKTAYWKQNRNIDDVLRDTLQLN